jgi:hypothetical protein
VADAPLPCHLTLDYSNPQWLSKWIGGEEGSLCTGALALMANINKLPRDPEIPRVEANRAVFSGVQDFIDHHRDSRVKSWSDEEDRLGQKIWAEYQEAPWAAPILLASLKVGLVVTTEDQGDV